MSSDNRKTLVLFDIDGTLTPSRCKATPEMLQILKELREKCVVGIVGGSDLPKQYDQLGDNVLDLVDYSFSENGLVAYKGREKIGEASIRDQYTQEQFNRFINWCLHYIADLDIPVKSGTFIETRTGMVNVSPIGRNCTYQQRLQFYELDKQKGIRHKMVEDMKKEFPEMNLQFSIGGQISIDVFPVGWTKVYCLKFVEDKFDDIHFFGDMTAEGGNDYEIFSDKRVKGHTVRNPEDTIAQVKEIFLKP
ncbi:Phosphomannomutase [Tritrichomonas foetus]|uniref:Phosphomannomutase n=1 Tax=Tritrichomonas foetus TaxID=1144522 RepID=A0A1J4JC56_9EUKA|nr:Phosphomannomutase [Tritrichomonas foetus]|eukprot:OHS96786.1 Phosphomannomutase [Tritrichomonas foetus]